MDSIFSRIYDGYKIYHMFWYQGHPVKGKVTVTFSDRYRLNNFETERPKNPIFGRQGDGYQIYRIFWCQCHPLNGKVNLT